MESSAERMLNATFIKQETQKRNQYIAALSVSLGAVCAGAVLGWTSPVLPQIVIPPANASNVDENITVTITNSSYPMENKTESNLQLTESEASLVGAILALGALVSALPAGYCADKFGRKKVNLALAAPFLINWILIVFAVNPYMLYVARFFAGVATGAICVTAPMYISEIAEVSVRGTVGSFFQMCICFGIFLTNFVGIFTNWIGLSWFLMVTPVMFAIAFYFMPESPSYLINKGHTTSAANSLIFLRGQSYKPDYELRLIEEEQIAAQEKSGGFSQLFISKGNRKALISALSLMFFQQFSGINAVIFYTAPIFQSAGSSLPPEIAAVIVSVVQFIISYVAAMIIEKANRRFYLMASSIGMMICLAALGMYFHLQSLKISFPGIGMIPLASLVLFIIAFSLGFGPVPWMIMGELFSPEIKGVGSGISVMFNWTLVFVVTFSFPIMNSNFGGHVAFYIFSIVMVLATAFVYYYLPETKGKTVQEIQVILNN